MCLDIARQVEAQFDRRADAGFDDDRGHSILGLVSPANVRLAVQRRGRRRTARRCYTNGPAAAPSAATACSTAMTDRASYDSLPAR